MSDVSGLGSVQLVIITNQNNYNLHNKSKPFRLAGYVESLTTKLGFEGPQLNSSQLQMTRTVIATNLVLNSFLYKIFIRIIAFKCHITSILVLFFRAERLVLSLVVLLACFHFYSTKNLLMSTMITSKLFNECFVNKHNVNVVYKHNVTTVCDNV